jgi:phosphoribosylanthranilate isomerase
MSRLVKICGLRDPENIREVLKLNPDFAGLIFHPASPRCVTDLDSLRFLNQINPPVHIITANTSQTPGTPTARTKVIGVFVDPEVRNILEITKVLHLDAIQLHGSETPETCKAIREIGFMIIKAFGIKPGFDFTSISAFDESVDYFLFDTASSKHGGTGLQFDWALLDEYQGKTPWILSGGISPETNEFPTHKLMAGVDLNSRFEIAPGIKDIGLLKKFIKKFRDE